MKRKLTLTTLFLAAALTTGLANAEAPCNDKRADQRLNHLQQALELTPEQSTSVKTIMEAHQQKMQAHRAEAKKMRDAFKAEMSGVLTPEQQQKFDNMRKQRRHAKGGPGYHQRRGDGSGYGQGQPAAPAADQ